MMFLWYSMCVLQFICFQNNLCGAAAARITNHFHHSEASASTLTAAAPTTAESVAPKGCKWQRNIKDTLSQDGENLLQNVLACKLKTIGGKDNVVLKNLTSNQIERINALKLECNDVLFYESSLEANHHSGAFLGSLKYLRDLTIEYCKIRYVPAMILSSLRDLNSFTLRTHNADWSSINLELDPESFRSLTDLRFLDLSDNNIWSLPTDVFCPLYSLRTLNLTRNRLTDISQLGFSDWGNGPTAPGKACNAGLERLDLSSNALITLPDNGLSALRSLQILLLNSNNLSALAERSFVGLGLLKILNISGNQLVDLPPELFQSTRVLEKLYLGSNMISTMGPGLLEGLDCLEILDLSANQLTSSMVNRDTFAGLIRLVVLNLSKNYLTKIDHHLFRGLNNLQILELGHNSIEVIANDAFSDLKNLVALYLPNNQLKTVEANHLSDLYVLTQLFLDSNKIEFIDQRAFENLTNLNYLSLTDNLLSELPKGLGKMRKLKSLDIGKNRITSVQNISFEGLEELNGLRLSDNFITNISRDAFITLSSVRVINLGSNNIRHIDQSAFSSNPTISAIRLDNNLLEDISGVFTSLQSLIWLNVSDNNLKTFDYSHLPKSLEWLDMHSNQITELRNYYDILTLKIKTLDVSYNQLTSINAGSVPDSIETLFLNHNKINYIAPGTFLRKHNLDKVILYGNELKHIEKAALIIPRTPEHRKAPELYLGSNPLHCDCKLEWLQRINDLSPRQLLRVMDLDSLICTLEHERGEGVRALTELHSNEFLCKYESHCFTTCHCCEFACDCKMTCPDKCSCYHNHAWSTNIVDCGNGNHTEVPDKIPMDASTIYLDGNNLKSLGSHMFIGKKKLEILYLNDSNIFDINNRTFNGIPSLKVLHLENNNLSQITDYDFSQMTSLDELYLHHNAIKTIGNQTFSNMKNLKLINLSENNLVDFQPWDHFDTAVDSGALSQVFIDGNDWKCDCASLNKLQDWIKNLSNDFDINNMFCDDQRSVHDAIESCSYSHTQGRAVTTPAVQRTILYNNALMGVSYVPALAAILVIIIGTALLVALICVFRQDVRLWMHSKYGLRLFKDPATDYNRNAYQYDSFVVYSIRDSDFVTQLITFELQHFGYTLFLHHRDVNPTMLMADALQQAANSSKKLLLILSMNFLQNEWSQPLYREALRSVLDSFSPAAKQSKIIVVLTVPFEFVVMDPILQLLVRKCTVICWGEKKFWDKLRFALPDIAATDSNEKLGNINLNPNLRYTLAPKTLDNLAKLSLHPDQGTRSPIMHNNSHFSNSNLEDNHCMSQSTCNTENESMSSITSSMLSRHFEPRQYEPRLSEQYICNSTGSLGHVYSTIPETPQMVRGGSTRSNSCRDGKNRAYFV